jgi:hypothetical protein
MGCVTTRRPGHGTRRLTTASSDPAIVVPIASVDEAGPTTSSSRATALGFSTPSVAMTEHAAGGNSHLAHPLTDTVRLSPSWAARGHPDDLG